MSEYLIQDTTLINIANPLRTLGETTGTKTPAQMAAIATNANTTIAAQGTLLDEVIAALEGKTASVPGGGGVPIAISTAAEMDAELIAENVGKVYIFIGTTDETYTNGDLYIVEAI